MFDTNILTGEEASTGYKQSVSIPLLHPSLTFPVAVSLSLRLSDSQSQGCPDCAVTSARLSGDTKLPKNRHLKKD